MLAACNLFAGRPPGIAVKLAKKHDEAHNIMMMIKRCLIVLTSIACCAAFSYAQTDGGVGGHAPARSQLVTSNSFSLTGAQCAGASDPNVIADCAAFSGGVQEVFAFYNQSGTPFNSLTINLVFNSANDGQYVGCTAANIGPTWTSANCENGPGVLINSSGQATLTFQQGVGGEGIGCYNANTSGSDLVTTGNQACLNNSVNAINADLGSFGTAKEPYVYYYPPAGSGFNGVPPPTQTTGACTVPPNGGIPINTILPWLVCGQDSWVLGVGLFTSGGPFSCGDGPNCTTPGDNPVISAEAYANTRNLRPSCWLGRP